MKALRTLYLLAAGFAPAVATADLEVSVVPDETATITVLGLHGPVPTCEIEVVTLPAETCDLPPDLPAVDRSTWPVVSGVAAWTFLLTLDKAAIMPDVIVFGDRRLPNTAADRSHVDARNVGEVTCDPVSRCPECGVIVATPAYNVHRCQLLLSDAELAQYATTTRWRVCTSRPTVDEPGRDLRCSPVAEVAP